MFWSDCADLCQGRHEEPLNHRQEEAFMSDEDQLDPRWHGASIDRMHWHFHRRLWSRYKIVLAPGEFSLIIKDIKNGKAQVLFRKSAKEAAYVFYIKSARTRIFVTADGTHLITALPPTKRLAQLRKDLQASKLPTET